jgi:DNA-binding winged helix-turn-helix (wHTH) protein
MKMKFGPFTLDERARQLLRTAQPVHLSPKAFDLLVLLIGRRPEAIAKAEIHEKLWPETFVSDVNLAVLVTEIRNALGEDARHPAFIRTVQRFGYAFSGAAVDIEHHPEKRPGTATCWLTWGKERATLSVGENVIGRDASADIRIHAVGVSRRHATVVVGDGDVVLHDLASKNGTYVDGVRLTAPMPLSDTSEILLGPVCVRFHRLASLASTQTVNPAARPRSRK